MALLRARIFATAFGGDDGKADEGRDGERRDGERRDGERYDYGSLFDDKDDEDGSGGSDGSEGSEGSETDDDDEDLHRIKIVAAAVGYRHSVCLSENGDV
jgi:hypothetical protein